MTKTLTLLSILALTCFGCRAPEPHVPAEPVTPAAAQPSAAPALSTAVTIHGKADGQAVVTADKVSSLSNQLNQVHKEATSAVAELDRMRKAKFAVEEDLVAFYNRLIEQEKAMKAMTLQVIDVEASLATERQLRTEEMAKLRETEILLRNKETEAELLRGQLSIANSQTTGAEKALRAANTNVEKLSAESQRLAGESAFKTKLLIGSGVLILLLVAASLLLLKFRSILPF